MRALWTSSEAEAATLGRASKPFEIRGMSIDTRTLKPGDLFVALKGETRDGHDFVSQAFDAKAAAAMVTHTPEGVGTDSALLTVGHTQRGLEDLARAARARSNAKIVAITGSAGKTTTKEMLRLALGALGRTHASSASYNNHWGVPFSVASMPRDCQFGIFEVGMNHFGEIRSLVSLVRPHVALVTTIAPAHLEFFGNCESIADAKSEIFERLAAGGIGLVPGDSPYASRLIARAKQAGVTELRTFGQTGDARLVSVAETAEEMRISADILGRKVEFRIAAVGQHIATNAVAVLLSVASVEGDILNAAAALAEFSALKGRGARFFVPVTGGRVEVIDESYNANPASMAATIAMLGAARPGKGGRRIAVLGDMLEMGAEGPAHHAALARDIESARADLVFVNGPQMESLWSALPESRRGAYGKTSSEIVPSLMRELRAGDVVLVKGSLGSKMAVIIDVLKAHNQA